MPQQIVYLLGAGATFAEVKYRNARPLVNTLMRNIETENDASLDGVATRVLKQFRRISPLFDAISVDQDADIEKLISLLDGSGVESHARAAADLRRLYFQDIRKSLLAAKILRQPKLAMGLLQMHDNAAFKANVEAVSAIVTTNHDGLLQVASEKILKAMNLGFPFESSDMPRANGRSTIPILQLHGSLTWRFAVPPKVSRLDSNRQQHDTMWIPPTIQKESKAYPYNKLHALSYEALSERCDVLRVVGSSLTQNDWNILCLLFNAQKHRERVRRTPFKIELIMSQKGGTSVSKSCSFLENALVIGSLSDGPHFGEFKKFEKTDPPFDSDWANPFFFWLREKINFHRMQGHFGPEPLATAMKEIAEK
ncbi:MAG TPA: hypothetical protein VLL54_21650 [Pyrinomonadaceae bacterium]|nr:hypothetical protein [Pyrinomonadaceae bacterium]